MILTEKKKECNSWDSQLILDACLFFVTALYTHTRLSVSALNLVVPLLSQPMFVYQSSTNVTTSYVTKDCVIVSMCQLDLRTIVWPTAGHLPDKALHYPTDLSLLPFHGYLSCTCETYSKRVQIGARDLWIRGTDYSSQVPLFKIGVSPQQCCSASWSLSLHILGRCGPPSMGRYMHHVTRSTRARMRLLPFIGVSEIVKMWLQLLSFHTKSEGVIKIYRRDVTPFLWELNLK